jgi:EAL domain-containing protein (putative c-di-GMP-specific phosphodiesterase class I)
MAKETDSGPAREEMLRPREWSDRITEALERDLFVLHGQRIVDVQSGETMRHELFLRMVDRKRLIPAGEFVMAAEEFGSIREIDRWVVGRAIEVAATGRPVDLNLSMRSTDEAMLELIGDRLEETGAKPGDIVFELSEEQLAAAAKARSEFVHAVAELGCQVALDAFEQGGRGSFLLRQFPIGYIKLGPPFIQDLAADRNKRRSVSDAVLKAHRHGQRVIAQGVETLVTLDLLEDLGIDEVQGNALGPPESLESLIGAAV